MDLVSKFQQGSLTADNTKEFKTMIKRLLSADNENMYNIMIDYVQEKKQEYWKGLSAFYREYLKKPDTFSEFLEIIYTSSMKSRNAIYKGANILTIMSCLVFHISALYIMMHRKFLDTSTANNFIDVNYDQLCKEAAHYYHKPFAKWIEKILYIDGAEDFILKQNLNQYEFLNAFEYLMLMSYVSKELELEDRPLFAFLNAIEEKYEKDKLAGIRKHRTDYFHIDTFNDMMDVLVNFESYQNQVDLYDIDLKIQYLVYPNGTFPAYKTETAIVNYKFFLALNYNTKPDALDDHVFRNHSYDIENFIIRENEILNYYDNQEKLIEMIENHISKSTVMTFLYFNSFLEIYLYNMDDDDMVVIDDNWNLIIKHLYDNLQTSDNVKLDAYVMWFYITYESNFNHFYYQKQTFLFPIIRNTVHFSQNAEFIRNLIKALLFGNYDDFKYMKYMATYQKKKTAHKLLMAIDKDEDIIVLLLHNLFGPNTRDSVGDLHQLSAFVDKSQSIHSSVKALSFEQYMSPDNPSNLREFFKDILQHLLKLRVKYPENVTVRYFRNLRKYREDLLGIGIDLDKYKIASVGESPKSNSRGSINRSNIEGELPNIPGNIFKKTVKTTVNGAENVEMKDIEFVNKPLMKSMQKVYIRTVESKSEKEYDGTDRISKIRKYFQKKNPRTADNTFRFEIKVGEEFNALYEAWLRARAADPENTMPLNRGYFIKYSDSRGIDAGGLTKQFFANISNTLLEVYFKPAYDGSTRYILNSKNIASDDVARFIGELLMLFIIKEYYLDFHLSVLYLAKLMFKKEDLADNAELFLYYLLDIDPETRYDTYLSFCENNYTYQSEYDEEYYKAMRCDPDYIVEEMFPTVYTHKPEHFEAFSEGFALNKKIFYSKFLNINSKIRLYDLDKLLSMSKLRKKLLKKVIFEKISIEYNNRIIRATADEAKVYTYLQHIMVNCKKDEYKALYSAYDARHIHNDVKKEKMHKSLENSDTFRKNVLFFWTGSRGISPQPYRIKIDAEMIIPEVAAHTCSNQLDLPLPNVIRSVQELFNIFMNIFIEDLQGAFLMA